MAVSVCSAIIVVTTLHCQSRTVSSVVADSLVLGIVNLILRTGTADCFLTLLVCVCVCLSLFVRACVCVYFVCTPLLRLFVKVPMQIPALDLDTSSDETDSGVVADAASTDAVETQFLNQWKQAAVPETARRAVEDFDSLARSCESLACLVRDRRMLNRSNIAMCVHAVRTLGQATSSGVVTATSPGIRGDSAPRASSPVGNGTPGHAVRGSQPGGAQRHRTVETNHTNLSNQVLDLMHTLHDHAAMLFVVSVDPLPPSQRKFVHSLITCCGMSLVTSCLILRVAFCV